MVKTAVESGKTKPTVLVGDDTDLLVLLRFYTQEYDYEIYFRLEPKARSRVHRVWHMDIKHQLGDEVCRNFLFLHAGTCCDTTSRLHGVGSWSWRMHLMEQAKVFGFSLLHTSASDVVTAGEKALVTLFGGKPGTSLNKLRYQRYYKKLAFKTSHVQPQNLPPDSTVCVSISRHSSVKERIHQ